MIALKLNGFKEKYMTMDRSLRTLIEVIYNQQEEIKDLKRDLGAIHHIADAEKRDHERLKSNLESYLDYSPNRRFQWDQHLQDLQKITEEALDEI
jgi:hypothetical protein